MTLIFWPIDSHNFEFFNTINRAIATYKNKNNIFILNLNFFDKNNSSRIFKQNEIRCEYLKKIDICKFKPLLWLFFLIQKLLINNIVGVVFYYWYPTLKKHFNRSVVKFLWFWCKKLGQCIFESFFNIIFFQEYFF